MGRTSADRPDPVDDGGDQLEHPIEGLVAGASEIPAPELPREHVGRGDQEVDREVARLFAARARKEAVELNRAGNYRLATERMQAVARRIRGYAGTDPILLSIVAELEQEQTVVAAAMPAPAAKQMLFSSSYQMRFRDATGKPLRRS